MYIHFVYQNGKLQRGNVIHYLVTEPQWPQECTSRFTLDSVNRTIYI